MTAVLFLGFVATLAGAVMIAAIRFLPRRGALGLAAGLTAWLAYVGLLGWFGIVGNAASRPPGIAYVVGPVLVFIPFVIARGRTGAWLAAAIPLPVLLAAQTFRIGVELFLHRLWIEGLVPKMLTFAGANLDIWVGVTAPLAAWAATRGRTGLRVALGWNVLGLAALANVVLRSALTAPGPLNFVRAEVPNLAIGTFPFLYIAGFLAPLAVSLHVLSIRAIRTALKEAPVTLTWS